MVWPHAHANHPTRPSAAPGQRHRAVHPPGHPHAAIEYADTPHDVHQVVAHHRQAMHSLFHDVAAIAGARDPAALASQVQVLVDGAMIGAIIDRGPDPIRAARAQVEILLAAADIPEQ